MGQKISEKAELGLWGMVLFALVCACVPIALLMTTPAQCIAATLRASDYQQPDDTRLPGNDGDAGMKLKTTSSSSLAIKALVKANDAVVEEPPSAEGETPTMKTVSGLENVVSAKTVKGTKYLFLPSYANLKEVRLCNAAGKRPLYVSAKKNGQYRKKNSKQAINVTSCSRDKSGAYTLYVKKGPKSSPVAIKVMKSRSIRTIYLKSKDPKKKGRRYIESSRRHTAEAKGSMTLVASNGDVVYSGKLTQIKGRGNSTWSRANKKSYQIKLGEKVSLLDGTDSNAAKTWLLLANAFDDTFMRNYMALKTARAIGMEETPDCEFADLYYDGVYLGNYLLCEKVQVKGGRVDITEQENESRDKKGLDSHSTAIARNKYGRQFKYVKGVNPPKDITGGYLIELDNGYYYRERCWFKTSLGYFVVKSPENASKEQVKYISEYTQAAINDLSKRGTSKRIDMQSLSRAHLVNELCKSPDYMRHSSTYFFKDKGKDVLHAGPVWDFDLAFGIHIDEHGHSYTSTSGYASSGYANYYTSSKRFKSVNKRIFKKVFLPQAKGLVGKSKKSSVASIARIKNQISRSVTMERTFRSVDKFRYVERNFSSWGSSLNYTARWISARITWMTKNIL